MLLKKQHKITLLIFSVIAILIGVFISFRLPDLQMKTSQALAWFRMSLKPAGSLPTAEAKTIDQQSFWLPGLMSSDAEFIGISSLSTPPQTKLELPISIVLPAPAFNPQQDYQDWNNCGPATLALGLRYWGWQGDQFTISDLIRPKRSDKNVNIEELAGYVNQSTDELQAEVRMGGNVAALEGLIAAGYPVIIEEAFTVEKSAWPGDDLWAGHYILLTGYDRQSQLFTAQDSYHGPDRQLAYSDVATAWQAFNHVYLVIFPTGDQPKIQQLLGTDWPLADNLMQTAAALQRLVISEQTNAFAWFNLGSSLTALEEYASAVQAFDKARALGLPARMLRYQFGPLVAAYHTGNQKDLNQLADYALQITPDSEEALLWKGWAYELAGDHLSAISLFNKALEANPGYQEAQKALTSVRP
ncbi:MAG: hypothetical protein CVU42_08260 [Chloroflexi bacterium HGW-Chloroflexi-4]|jgi:tetratricopeptide (TPR) repeat protein|nr:MAG: hypothetical protein CVU42_08260 [Chloroflexi bacterium HGW-Chloroflexi-4]